MKEENMDESNPQSLQVSDASLSHLREIAQRGAERAGGAIQKLIDHRVNIFVQDVHTLPVEQVAEMISGATTIVTTVYLKITGDIAGSILLIFPNDTATSIADLLLKRDVGTTNQLDEESRSALKEVGNILSGAFLAEISDDLNLKLIESVPDLADGIVQATIDTVLIDFARSAEQAFTLSMRFSSEEASVDGYFFVLFDSASARIIINALNEKG